MADMQAQIDYDWGGTTRLSKTRIRLRYRVRVGDVDVSPPDIIFDQTFEEEFTVHSFEDLQSQIEGKIRDRWRAHLEKDPADPVEWPIPAGLPTSYRFDLPETVDNSDPIDTADGGDR